MIFSDEVSPDVIDKQFLSALHRHFHLTPYAKSRSIEWSGVLSRDSLFDLGTRIIQSVPAEERRNFGSPLLEGFNNFNVSIENLREVLKSSYFEHKFITAVGKTEWSNIKWNDKSIADKKDIINSSDVVFTAADDISDFEKAKRSLIAAEVNSTIIDCSDAHSFANSSRKDRLGHCLTWVKADTTFNGLLHSLIEADERIFVGQTPPELESVHSGGSRYIRSLNITKKEGDRGVAGEDCVNVELPFNHGLVAISGTKGAGRAHSPTS